MNIFNISYWKSTTKIYWVIWYFAAATFFFGIYMLNLTYIHLAILLFIFNSLVTDNIIKNIDEDYEIKSRKVITYLLIKFITTFVIVQVIGVSHYFFCEYIYDFSIEPVLFGILYLVLYILLTKFYRLVALGGNNEKTKYSNI